VTHRRLFAVALAAALAPAATRAQGLPPYRREIRGFDFHRDGVWRRQARAVHARRARLLARRDFPALNAPIVTSGGVPLSSGAPLASVAAVSGILRVPALLFRFRDSPTPAFTAAAYTQVLFASAPPSGRPYTYRTFYEQLSNGLFSIQGTAYGYVTLDNDEVKYTGGTSTTCLAANPFNSTNCNGLFSDSAVGAMQTGLTQALKKIDASVDWRPYDGDGDGYVDLMLFIHEAPGGECGPRSNPENHLWAHRYQLLTPYVTHSVNSAGIRIKVRDYVLQSGVGGASACDSTQIMPIGTVAHETGHGLGLPDLYDVSGKTEGIGEYGLMGSGNYTSGSSPSRMEAWSLNDLGWVTIAPLWNAGVYSFGPAPTSDTAFYVPVEGPNPRGEYFLLENRQAVQSDSAMLRYHCLISGYPGPPPGGCGGGLLIWHIDSTQVANTRPLYINSVNSGPIHGVALVQADGLGNLDVQPTDTSCFTQTPGCSNRGDAGDPYPGWNVGNTAFGRSTVPADLRNADGKPAGIRIDQIFQLAPDGPMSFRLSYPVWVARAVDTAAVIHFDTFTVHVFRGELDSGSTHTVSVADTQYTAGGRTRQVFESWSDGGAISHTYTAGAAPETLTVTLARWHKLLYSGTPGGTVAADANATAVPSGTFLAQGTPVTLSATDTSGGLTPFVSWVGDTVSKNPTITLPMGRPYTVRAAFLSPLATADVVAQLLNGTGPLTPQQLQQLDQLGNSNGRFDVGDFLAWVQATGAPLPTALRAMLGGGKPKGTLR
jgi:M6 family metalloprotease-like protein